MSDPVYYQPGEQQQSQQPSCTNPPPSPVPQPIYTVAGGNPIPNQAMAPQSSPVPIMYAAPTNSPAMIGSHMPPPQKAIADGQKHPNPSYPGAPSPMDPSQAQQQQLTNGFIYAHELCPVDHQPHKFENKMTTCGLLWAVVCFPCGLICCMNQMESKCIKCGKLGMGPSKDQRPTNPTQN
jgi:hypothetical protein